MYTVNNNNELQQLERENQDMSANSSNHLLLGTLNSIGLNCIAKEREIMEEIVHKRIVMKFEQKLIKPYSPKKEDIFNKLDMIDNICEPPPMLKHMSSSQYLLLPWHSEC